MPMLSHHRRDLSNVSKDELEVENTGCGLKEAFPPRLLAQVRPPRLYAVLSDRPGSMLSFFLSLKSH